MGARAGRHGCFVFARAIWLLALFAVTTYTQSADPLPSGPHGIAAKYPHDLNIKSDPRVIFADDFESYSSASQLGARWDDVYHPQNVTIAPDRANGFSRSLQMRVPARSTEIADAVVKKLNPAQNILFVRVYTKFGAGYNVSGSEHNGIAISSQYCCPGVPANGTDRKSVV